MTAGRAWLAAVAVEGAVELRPSRAEQGEGEEAGRDVAPVRAEVGEHSGFRLLSLY